MDLAIKFNDIGCAYYQEGCTEHAYDLFCGAMQALHHSATSNHCTLEEMDGLGRQMLLVDPSIQRAFDKIDFTPTHCGTHHVPSIPGEDNTNSSRDLRSSTQLLHKIDRPPAAATAADATMTAAAIPPSSSSAVAMLMNSARRIHASRSMDEYVFEWKRVFTVDGLQHYNYRPSVYSSILSASILFNQAVVLHTGGVPTSRRALERALTLYSMAAKRLFEGCPRFLLMADEYTTTLTCAVLNNTGYLLHQMGEYGGSQLCFSRLNEFLHQLGPSQSIHDKRRRDEFGLNILIFWRPLSGAAAA